MLVESAFWGRDNTREGTTVRGLTTAASLWTVAAIGLAIGSGFYYAAGITTLLTFITLISLSNLKTT